MRYVYLDAAATTRCADEVTTAMLEFEATHFGNASSPHRMGQEAMRAVDKAAESIAELLRCRAGELTFTSGATESNNIVILGSQDGSRLHQNAVFCPIDHKSTLEAMKELARRGVETRSMKIDHAGRIDLDHLQHIVDENTSLVTLALVNSELGTIQDVDGIAAILDGHTSILHIDATQAVGKIAIDMRDSRVDCMSISAHKISGPKGIGALYVSERLGGRLKPLTFGGGQSYLRSGTLPSPLIVGFGVAAHIILRSNIRDLWERARHRQSIILSLLDQYANVYLLNSVLQYTVPHILNVAFLGVRSETIIKGLPTVCLSSGSACNSHSLAPSYVLTGVGHDNDRANCSIRVSFIANMDVDDLSVGAETLARKVQSLQALFMGENQHG